MNNFLKSRQEVDVSTQYLIDNNLIQSGLSCKNWEISSVIPYLNNGNIADLGSSGSVVLQNAVRMNLNGLKVGVDLAYEQDYTEGGVLFYKDDLMATSMGDELFDTVTSLSVIEHSVDINKFAKEVGRLLKPNGKAFVSFDYWPFPLNTKGVWLYNLEWSILCKEDVENLVEEFKKNGLELTSEIDWTTQDAVINSSFCSPVIGVEYTFGILNFIKK